MLLMLVSAVNISVHWTPFKSLHSAPWLRFFIVRNELVLSVCLFSWLLLRKGIVHVTARQLALWSSIVVAVTSLRPQMYIWLSSVSESARVPVSSVICCLRPNMLCNSMVETLSSKRSITGDHTCCWVSENGVSKTIKHIRPTSRWIRWTIHAADY